MAKPRKEPEPLQIPPDAPDADVFEFVDEASLGVSLRVLRAMQLRRDGHDYMEIGAIMGIGTAMARELVKTGLELLHKELQETIDEVLVLELSRLDALHKIHWATAKDSKSADILLKISDRRSKFLGMDQAPKGDNDGATAVRDFLYQAMKQSGKEADYNAYLVKRRLQEEVDAEGAAPSAE
jgi:hypothetical protein